MSKKANGRKKLTLDEIAELAGTTKSTVSRVLSNHPRISDATKARVMAIVKEHGYQPNLVARGLAQGRTGLIGVLSSNIGSGFFADVIRGVDIVATDNDRHLLCSFAHSVEDFDALVREMALGGQVEGLVLIAPYMEIFDSDFVDGVPMVLCAARPAATSGPWAATDTVTLNNRKAMSDIIAHLHAEGHRHLVHMTGPDNNMDAFERKAAFVESTGTYEDIKAEVFACGMIREDGEKAARLFLEEFDCLPDAFVMFNDSTALGLIEVLREKYPNNTWPAAVTGWDDEPLAVALGLTSIEMPTTKMGCECGRLLLERLEGEAADTPNHAVVDLKLHIRSSSRDRFR